MENIYIWSPILFGAVIGWLIVYFTRKLTDFSAKSLTKVAAVSIVGTGFCSLTFISDVEIGSQVIMCYLLGVGCGFFLHWIYQVIIALCFRKKFYDHRMIYDLLSGCNIPSKENVKGFTLHRKAEKLIVCYKQWDKGKITDDELIEYIKESGIEKSEFDSMINENQDYLLLDDETLTTIKAKKWDQYFK